MGSGVRSEMTMPWEKTPDPLDIPECLKRDKNNKAPFMLKEISQKVMTEYASTFMLSPAINPQSTPPDWTPPWSSKC